MTQLYLGGVSRNLSQEPGLEPGLGAAVRNPTMAPGLGAVLSRGPWVSTIDALPEQREAAAGLPPPPPTQAAAKASSPLQVPQAAMVIGEPLPVIFCRRRDNVGGVLVFPKATEARFENDSTTVTSRYHLVVSDGQIGSIQRRDVRCGECRIGTFSQNFDKRAGNWVPGNFATTATGYVVPTFPTFTGGGGSYKGITTLEAGASFTGGSDDWRMGWNLFIREGITISRGRLIDSVVGPSDNIADLVLWALQRSSRVPDALIDLPSFRAAATFCEANGLWCNGEFGDSANLGDWLARILPYFLLRETRVAGKYGLRPLLPTNSNGTIRTTAVTPEWVLTEAIVIPESLQIDYTDAATRRPPIFQMIWRQQHDDTEVPIPRTLTVGDTNITGPIEQHDLSQFATSELHAARVGAYRLARRTLSTHTATVKLRPGTQTSTIAEGDIVQLYLQVESDREPVGVWNHFYTVEAVGTAWTGEEQLTLSHLPVDRTGRPLIARAVAEITAPGAILSAQRTGSSCDIAGASTDTTVPASTTGGNLLTAALQSQWVISGGSPIDWWAWMASIDWTGGPASDKPPAPGALPPKADSGDPGEFSDNWSATSYQVRVQRTGMADTVITICSTTYPVITFPTNASVVGQGVRITYTSTTGQTVDQNEGFGEGFTGPVILGGCGTFTPDPEQGSIPNPTYPASYTVQKGDTLWGIAEKFYGDGSRWPEIYAIAGNKAIIGSDPNLILPGQVLSVPAP